MMNNMLLKTVLVSLYRYDEIIVFIENNLEKYTKICVNKKFLYL
jgi:hypothetical protein